MTHNVRIAYDNLLLTADTVIADGEQAGFEAINLLDWRTNTMWKAIQGPVNDVVATFPSPVQPTAFGVFHHNLNGMTGGAIIRVYYWSGSVWVRVSDPLSTPLGVVMHEFPLPTAPSTQWKIEFSTSATVNIPSVAHWFLGDFISLKSQKPNFGPAIYNDRSKFRTELSESGQFLGRTFEVSDTETSIGLDLLQPGEVESVLYPWIQHTKYSPFYYSWDHVNHPDQAAYCWTDRPINVQYYRTPQFMRLNARLTARVS